jgi:hypothetical protein
MYAVLYQPPTLAEPGKGCGAQARKARAVVLAEDRLACVLQRGHLGLHVSIDPQAARPSVRRWYCYRW